jgi:hypothetical protein
MQINKSTIVENQPVPLSVNEHFIKAEKDLLTEALLRTHQERFLFATKLYKIQKTMEKFSIVHKPYNLKK